MPTTIFDLIRHGEPEGGPKFRGSLDDPLSEQGWLQMKRAVDHPSQWDMILTSPLTRCRTFAEDLAGKLNLPCHVEPDLQEISFGEWEGKTSQTIMEESGELLTRFWANPVAHRPPGGEALTAFYERVLHAWSQWQLTSEGQRVLLVCHGGTIRMILADVLGIPLDRSFSGFAVPYACRSRIRIDRTEHGVFSSLLSHTP